jgi:hypothetical protein
MIKALVGDLLRLAFPAGRKPMVAPALDFAARFARAWFAIATVDIPAWKVSSQPVA